jgi:hypothetical protein
LLAAASGVADTSRHACFGNARVFAHMKPTQRQLHVPFVMHACVIDESQGLHVQAIRKKGYAGRHPMEPVFA